MRLRQGIEAMKIVCCEKTISITASIGVAALSEGDFVESDVLVEMADQALYEAKEAGRNQVRSWIPEGIPVTRNTQLSLDVF
jgi:diguanylate cyclase (GGDEF)-like protein